MECTTDVRCHTLRFPKSYELSEMASDCFKIEKHQKVEVYILSINH